MVESIGMRLGRDFGAALLLPDRLFQSTLRTQKASLYPNSLYHSGPWKS